MFKTLQKLGIQPKSYFAMIKAFVLMDMRGQYYEKATGSKPSDVFTPLYWVYGQLLVVSLLSCLILQSRVDSSFYAFVNLTLAGIFTWAAVVVEFHEAAVNPRDIKVIGHKPITSKTWAAARLTNLFIYVLLVFFSLSIFPSIMGFGLNDTGFYWLAIYPVSSLLVCVSGASLALMTFTFFGLDRNLDRARLLASWIQIILILILFYGGQLLLRDAAGNFEHFAAKPSWEIGLFPTWIIAEAVASESFTDIGLFGLFALSLLLFSLLLLNVALQKRNGKGFSKGELLVAPVSTGSLSSRLVSTVLGREAGMYASFSIRMLFRDSPLKSKNWASLSMPIAIVILGVLTDQYSDPMVDKGSGLLPIVTFGFLGAAIPTVVNNCRFSNDYLSAWRFSSRWGSNARRGVKVAILSCYFFSFSILHGLLILFVWDSSVSVLLHTAISIAMLEFIARVSVSEILTFPVFSEAYSRGATFGVISFPLIRMAIVSSFLSGIWFLFASSQWLLILLFVGLVSASLFWGRMEVRRERTLPIS